jgi:hypothetical protein
MTAEKPLMVILQVEVPHPEVVSGDPRVQEINTLSA